MLLRPFPRLIMAGGFLRASKELPFWADMRGPDLVVESYAFDNVREGESRTLEREHHDT